MHFEFAESQGTERGGRPRTETPGAATGPGLSLVTI